MKKLRARCPICSRVSDLDHFEGPVTKIQVFVQEFGGKVKGETTGRGSAKGAMSYTDVTETEKGQEIVEMIRKRLKKSK